MQWIITALTNIKLFFKSSLVFRTLSLILKIVAIVILKSLFFFQKNAKTRIWDSGGHSWLIK